jgi:hypothetical protein
LCMRRTGLTLLLDKSQLAKMRLTSSQVNGE